MAETGAGGGAGQGGRGADDAAEPMRPPFWWCLTHARVEGRDGCANSDRLGPYETIADAENALARARERTEQWDNDPRWS